MKVRTLGVRVDVTACALALAAITLLSRFLHRRRGSVGGSRSCLDADPEPARELRGTERRRRVSVKRLAPRCRRISSAASRQGTSSPRRSPAAGRPAAIPGPPPERPPASRPPRARSPVPSWAPRYELHAHRGCGHGIRYQRDELLDDVGLPQRIDAVLEWVRQLVHRDIPRTGGDYRCGDRLYVHQHPSVNHQPVRSGAWWTSVDADATANPNANTWNLGDHRTESGVGPERPPAVDPHRSYHSDAEPIAGHLHSQDGRPDDGDGGRPDGDLHLRHREHGQRHLGQRRRDRCPAGTLARFEPRSHHVHHGHQRVHHLGCRRHGLVLGHLHGDPGRRRQRLDRRPRHGAGHPAQLRQPVCATSTVTVW